MADSSLIEESILSRCLNQLDRDKYERAMENQNKMEKISSTLLSLCPAFSILSALLSLVSIILTIHAINSHRLPNKKHTVVISRCLGDFFTSLLIAMSSLLSSSSSSSFTLLALFLYISTFGFVQLSLSHLLIVLLRQMSLTRPIGFSTFLTFRKLIVGVLLIWVVSVLYAASFAPLTTVILSPRLRQSVCSYSSCQKPLLAVCLSLLLFLLFSTLFSYIAVLYKLKKEIVSERYHGEPPTAKTQFRRFVWFGSHIVLFLVVSILLVIGIGLTLHNVWLYDKLSRDSSSCHIVDVSYANNYDLSC